MDNIKKTSELVKKILETVPETRNSDMLLYYRVCETLNNEALSAPFGMVILELKKRKLPGFETVRRSRQKIQREFPELAGCSAVEAHRTLNEEKFRDYAMG